jgi:hypothetical protein
MHVVCGWRLPDGWPSRAASLLLLKRKCLPSTFVNVGCDESQSGSFDLHPSYPVGVRGLCSSGAGARESERARDRGGSVLIGRLDESVWSRIYERQIGMILPTYKPRRKAKVETANEVPCTLLMFTCGPIHTVFCSHASNQCHSDFIWIRKEKPMPKTPTDSPNHVWLKHYTPPPHTQ